MKYISLFILLLSIANSGFAQSSIPEVKPFKYQPVYPGSANDLHEELLEENNMPKCSDMISYIFDKGKKIGEVDDFKLSNSSWLKSVIAYEYNNMIFNIVIVKKEQFSFEEKSYIFCKIPKINWQRFSQASDLGKTYGEKFHLYIFDYKCNCR